jgi:hypothetical protein
MQEQTIGGLLPGLKLVRLGLATDDEYEQIGDRIVKGPRGWSQIIVEPLEGWKLIYDISADCYRAVKVLPEPRIFSVQFEARNEADLERLDKMRQMPGVTGVSEVKEA